MHSLIRLLFERYIARLVAIKCNNMPFKDSPWNQKFVLNFGDKKMCALLSLLCQ